jgi:hypothetical protein
MRFRSTCSVAVLLFALSLLAAPSPVRAWGCKGHQTIALIAEQHLTPETIGFVERLLGENPVDPQFGHYCGGPDLGLLAAASTWPDDIRRQRPETAPWHYINIPRGAPRHSPAEYCGAAGCITKSIAEQLVILKDKNAPPAKRAEALRFVVHFIGDLHMPLHASDNNDLGGNCVPVKFFRRRPRERSDSFSPNLHSIWDTAILERDMEGAEPPEYANFLQEVFAARVDAWQNAGIHVEDWAWESHDLAESVAYAALIPKIPIESALTVHSCADADHIGTRMLALHVSAGEDYQHAASTAIEERLAQAGIRLAMILNEAASSTPTK